MTLVWRQNTEWAKKKKKKSRKKDATTRSDITRMDFPFRVSTTFSLFDSLFLSGASSSSRIKRNYVLVCTAPHGKRLLRLFVLFGSRFFKHICIFQQICVYASRDEMKKHGEWIANEWIHCHRNFDDVKNERKKILSRNIISHSLDIKYIIAFVRGAHSMCVCDAQRKFPFSFRFLVRFSLLHSSGVVAQSHRSFVTSLNGLYGLCDLLRIASALG